MREELTVVRGRRLERLDAAALRDLVGKYSKVIVDLGTGDGRWLYRLARSRPDVLCVGIDANTDRLRRISFRAARKPARGGLPNVRYGVAAVEAMPAVLRDIADEAWVVYPWGSLLDGVVRPDPALLRGIAQVLKPRGLLTIVVNASALGGGRRRGSGAVPTMLQLGDPAWRAGYNEAGLKVTSVRAGHVRMRSSWGARLGQGRSVRTVWIEAVRDGDRRDHGRGRDGAGTPGAGAQGPPARGHRDHPGVPHV